REAAPEHGVGSTSLDHPLLHRSIGFFDVDVNPGVWIDPIHLGHRACELDWLVRVKLCPKRVMRRDRNGGQQKGDTGDSNEQLCSHRPHLVFYQGQLDRRFPEAATSWQLQMPTP